MVGYGHVGDRDEGRLTCRQIHETGLPGTGYWRPSGYAAVLTATDKNWLSPPNDRFGVLAAKKSQNWTNNGNDRFGEIGSNSLCTVSDR